MRLKAGPSGDCPRRAFPPLHLGSSDRCGVVVLSRAGPKPCQTRDRCSRGTCLLFSVCPRGPSPDFSPLAVGEGEEGGGWVAASGPDLRSPVPRLGWRQWGPWVF